MKKYISKLIIGLTIFSGMFMVACDDVDPVADSLEFDRLFAPIGVEASINNSIKVNLSWKPVTGAEGYVVEIYKDSMLFDPINLVYSVTVADTRLIHDLESDTRYSAQIKATSSSTEESKWYGISFLTEVPDIYLATEIGNVGSDFAILRFPIGTPATKITLTPASGSAVSVTLSEEEIATGIVKVSGLAASQRYTAVLYLEKQKISKRELTTLKEGTIVVSPEDDLVAILIAAKDNDAFILMPGDYIPKGVKIPISKSISISGYGENNKPTIHAHFEIGAVKSFELKYVTLDGSRDTGALLDHTIQFTTTNNCDTVVIEGCIINNYNKSFVAGASGVAIKLETMIINNTIISNVLTNSADFIDLRSGLIKSLVMTNSTFYNCAAARDFIRLDYAAGAFPGETNETSIDRCTFYAVANSLSKRIHYVRYPNNTVKVSNSIFANTLGYYTNQLSTAQPTCSSNNYWEAPGFKPGGSLVVDAKFDLSGTYSELDPKFSNAASGDFTVTNPAVTGGDPRWLK